MSNRAEKIKDSASWKDLASWLVYAAIGAGTSLVLAAVGTFTDLTGNDSGSNNDLGDFLPVVPIIAAAAALVFGLVVRTATASNAANRALALAVLGLLSVAVFWAGLPAVFAAGAACCALISKGTGARFSGKATASLGIAAITLALAVGLAIAG